MEAFVIKPEWGQGRESVQSRAQPGPRGAACTPLGLGHCGSPWKVAESWCCEVPGGRGGKHLPAVGPNRMVVADFPVLLVLRVYFLQGKGITSEIKK